MSILLTGADLEEAKRLLVERHYLHRLPRGKSYVFGFRGALVVISCSSAKHDYLLAPRPPRLKIASERRRNEPRRVLRGWIIRHPDGRWRARPYYKVANCVYRHLHLGYFARKSEAIRVCSEWQRLAKVHGPEMAARLAKPSSVRVWELSRLWAPADHEANVLTRAISRAVAEFHRLEPEVEALIAYTDPNVGHTGGVYRAASWHPCGVTIPTPCYLDEHGRFVAERGRHAKDRFTKRELRDKGWSQLLLPAKLRFAFGLTKSAKRIIEQRFPVVAKSKQVA